VVNFEPERCQLNFIQRVLRAKVVLLSLKVRIGDGEGNALMAFGECCDLRFLGTLQINVSCDLRKFQMTDAYIYDTIKNKLECTVLPQDCRPSDYFCLFLTRYGKSLGSLKTVHLPLPKELQPSELSLLVEHCPLISDFKVNIVVNLCTVPELLKLNNINRLGLLGTFPCTEQSEEFPLALHQLIRGLPNLKHLQIEMSFSKSFLYACCIESNSLKTFEWFYPSNRVLIYCPMLEILNYFNISEDDNIPPPRHPTYSPLASSCLHEICDQSPYLDSVITGYLGYFWWDFKCRCSYCYLGETDDDDDDEGEGF